MVAEPAQEPAAPFPLAEAQAWCQHYTKERAKNFYYAFAILPPDKRNAIYAAYAFSGMVDDIADELTDREEQVRQLAAAREKLHACVAGDRQGALYTALGSAFDRFQIPVDLFDELVNGVEMDFTINRYVSWEDLRQYCFRVASMIGLICAAVFGAKDAEVARQYAIDMGIALQIVNIMRDVKEDAERGRVYFPAEDLARHGLTPDDILSGRYDARFEGLMEEYGKRARRYFRSGRRLLPLVDLRSRMCVNVLQGVYAAILREIERRDYDVMSERVSLGSVRKLVLIGQLWGRAALIRPK